jgi:maltose alpha-D-glucosyltransferase/alpha-amylase
MTQVGRRVAEMHVALASRDDIADFRPDPVTPDDIATWIDDIVIRADRVMDRLRGSRDSTGAADRPSIAVLLSAAGSLRLKLQQMADSLETILKIRHHGDFHLGQMLIVKDDIFIIDFEGEPRRSLSERRRKAPAARDIAGLIRSIDYSTTAALERALKIAPDDQGHLAAALQSWRERAITSFSTAYHENIGSSPLWPADQAAADQVLNIFLLEKVFYEIEYEIAYRPEWLHVPISGALQILSRIEEVTA